MPKLQRYRSHQFISTDNREGEDEMGEIRYVQVPKSDLVFTIKIPTTSSENPVSAQDSIIIAFDNEVAELRASRDKWKALAESNHKALQDTMNLIDEHGSPTIHAHATRIMAARAAMHQLLIEEDSK